MDARDASQDVLERAEKERDAGNYRAGVELVRPLLQAKRKEKLSPQQEHDAAALLGDCYRLLHDFKAALLLVQRGVVLSQQRFGPRSEGHAQALKGLCIVQQGLKAFPKARKAILEALAIMEELGLQQHEQYGSMLRELGRLDREQGLYKEALVIFDKAKAVLVQHKEGNEYGALLNSMGGCHEKLQQWSEAVACFKEDVEHIRNLQGNNHPHYATALFNLAVLFARLKQYEEAIREWRRRLPSARGCMATNMSTRLGSSRISPRSASSPRNPTAVPSMWATTFACAAAVELSQRSSSPVPAIVHGTATPTASCSTGRRTSRIAACAFTAARC
jgi:tetratricopeptide (TPR) repeat protein